MRTRSGLNYSSLYVGQKALIDGRWVKHGFGRQVFMHPVSKRLMCYAGGFRNDDVYGFSILYYLDETHGARFDRYICRGRWDSQDGQLIVRRRRLRNGTLHIPINELQLEFAKAAGNWIAPACCWAWDGIYPLRAWSSKRVCSAVDESAGDERSLFGTWMAHMPSEVNFDQPMPKRKGHTIYVDEDGNRSTVPQTCNTFEPPPRQHRAYSRRWHSHSVRERAVIFKDKYTDVRRNQICLSALVYDCHCGDRNGDCWRCFTRGKAWYN